MTRGSGDQTGAGTAGLGRLRASHADREHVIGVLKAGFVQGLLTKDEFDARVAQTFTSRTYAELAAVTADIPTGLIGTQPPRKPARARARPPVNISVIIATTVLTAGLWAAASVTNFDNGELFMLVFSSTFAWLGFLIISGMVLLESRREERSRGQRPVPRAPSAGVNDDFQRHADRDSSTDGLWSASFASAAATSGPVLQTITANGQAVPEQILRPRGRLIGPPFPGAGRVTVQRLLPRDGEFVGQAALGRENVQRAVAGPVGQLEEKPVGGHDPQARAVRGPARGDDVAGARRERAGDRGQRGDRYRWARDPGQRAGAGVRDVDVRARLRSLVIDGVQRKGKALAGRIEVGRVVGVDRRCAPAAGLPCPARPARR